MTIYEAWPKMPKDEKNEVAKLAGKLLHSPLTNDEIMTLRGQVHEHLPHIPSEDGVDEWICHRILELHAQDKEIEAQ